MSIEHRGVLGVVFITDRDKTLNKIWPLRSIRDVRRDAIKDGLDWLAVEFGFKSR